MNNWPIKLIITRHALINVDTLKLNFLTSKENAGSSYVFSSDFKWCLCHRVDGLSYIGAVVLP